jgi:predicted DNA-binding transcriptional regulator AlpA
VDKKRKLLLLKGVTVVHEYRYEGKILGWDFNAPTEIIPECEEILGTSCEYLPPTHPHLIALKKLELEKRFQDDVGKIMSMKIELAESSLQKFADLIGDKIMAYRNAPEPWIDIDALSAATGLAKKTIYKYTSTTNIPHKCGRPLKFKRSEVDAWLTRKR